MNKLHNSTHEAFAAFACSISLTAETKVEEMKLLVVVVCQKRKLLRFCILWDRTVEESELAQQE